MTILRSARLALLALLLVAAPRGAAAQQLCQADGNTEVTVVPVKTHLLFQPAGLSDFLNGWTVSTEQMVVRVEPRYRTAAWDLCISSLLPWLPGGKPIGDYEWRLQGTRDWTPLTFLPRQVTRRSGWQTVTIELRVRLYWETDAPGVAWAPLLVVAG